MTNRIASVVAFCFAVFFGTSYYTQHFQRRDCFNELGRCFDPETGVVYSQEAGPIWLLLTVLALGLGYYFARKGQSPKE